MMTKANIIFLLFCSPLLFAQADAVSTGGSATGIGGSLSFSVGQVYVQQAESGNVTVSPGVQQPYEIFLLDIPENHNPFDVVVYPNPATHYLNIRFGDAPATTVHCVIYSTDGKLVSERDISEKETQINIQGLEAATYYLRISTDKYSKTYSILKR